MRVPTAGAGDGDEDVERVGDEGGSDEVGGRWTEELDEDTECPRRRLRAIKRGKLAGERNYEGNVSKTASFI